MSRIRLRGAVSIVGAALLLRLAAAAVTERYPIFPAYYYTDVRIINEAARGVMDRFADGKDAGYQGTLSQRTQIFIQTSLYRMIGIHPFAMKIMNSLLGAAGVAAFILAAAAAFSPAAALSAAALCAVWPSNIFYTSQNFKEAPNNLLAYLALACLLPLVDIAAARRPAVLLAAAGTLCLTATGFYRSYVMLTLSAAIAAAALGAALARRGSSRPLAFALAAALCAPVLFRPAARLAESAVFKQGGADGLRSVPNLMPVTYDQKSENTYAPTSPRSISEFRRLRQEIDRGVSQKLSNREIATQIYPEARFETWFDLLAFLPKSAFQVLFMPLPGLYPLDGKLGRIAASLENLVLLALAALAAAGILRGPRTPARAAMLLFFFMMTVGSALLEFDLGSAGRHKLLYLPMLFPFAAEEILRLIGPKEPS